MSLLNDLQWRYATKKMNGEIVPQEKLDYILEAARLAPTSSGLQPFEILVITNKEILGKILPLAHGQSQVTDASHLLVFAAWDNYTEVWEMDHVLPLLADSVDINEIINRLCYTNIRPLSLYENRGRNNRRIL